MVFGTKVVIPLKVMILTSKTRFYNLEVNDKIMSQDLDIKYELRDIYKIRMLEYQ